MSCFLDHFNKVSPEVTTLQLMLTIEDLIKLPWGGMHHKTSSNANLEINEITSHIFKTKVHHITLNLPNLFSFERRGHVYESWKEPGNSH